VQLVVGLDVDDVLLDLMPRWLQEYNEEWDDALHVQDITSWDFYKFVLPACGKRIYNILSPEMYDDVIPLVGARQFVQDIRDRGHTPRYITACGDPAKTKLHKAFAAAKWDCLLRHEVAQEGELLLPGRDKSRAPVDMLIDDRIANVESFRNGLGVLFTQPWNRSSHLTRARSFGDALDLIDRYARHCP
jgi:5'(3')-deoxyribonucleotidase